MMLEVDALAAAYGRSQVLFGVSFGMRAGEVATLLGRNGMGKTTTVRSVMGMLRPLGSSLAEMRTTSCGGLIESSSCPMPSNRPPCGRPAYGPARYS